MRLRSALVLQLAYRCHRSRCARAVHAERRESNARIDYPRMARRLMEDLESEEDPDDLFEFISHTVGVLAQVKFLKSLCSIVGRLLSKNAESELILENLHQLPDAHTQTPHARTHTHTRRSQQWRRRIVALDSEYTCSHVHVHTLAARRLALW